MLTHWWVIMSFYQIKLELNHKDMASLPLSLSLMPLFPCVFIVMMTDWVNNTVHSFSAPGWFCQTIHIFSLQQISQQFISAQSRSASWNPSLQDVPTCPINAKERAEKRKAEQQERGQEPGIKQGHLIHTSRITASQTECSLSVADTTELCSLSPPSHLHTHCPSLQLAASPVSPKCLL